MRRFLLAVLLLVCTALSAQNWNNPEWESRSTLYAKQQFYLQGHVFGVDEFGPDPFPLQGANIKMTCMGDTTVFDGGTVYEDGFFWVDISRKSRFKDTRVRVEISYIGMEKFDSIFSPKKTTEDRVDTYYIKLDSLVLHSIPMSVDEVEIVAELVRMYQNGDTVIFNADAYEMPTGSVLLDLVRRLPGLKYKDGKMTYMDRDINEIRLNGDEFFKRDMTIALNNMPVDKIKSLHVYEVPDDTLYVSNDRHLVMDMKTKEPMDFTLFAEAEAATNEKFNRYAVSVNGSMWEKGGNDMYGSFSTSDIPGEWEHSLKTRNTNGNLSYSHRFDKVTLGVNGSYYSSSSTDKNDDYTKMFMPDYTQNSYSESESSYSSSDMNGSLYMNGNIGKNSNWNFNMYLSESRGGDSNHNVDSISNEGLGLVSANDQTQTSNTQNSNLNTQASYYYRFGQGNRYNLNTTVSYSHGKSKRVDYNDTESRFVQLGDSIRRTRHRILSPGENNSVTASVRLERRLGTEMEYKGHVELSYNLNYHKDTGVQSYEDILSDGSYRNVDSLHYDRLESSLNNNLRLSYYYYDSIYNINVSATARPVNEKADNLQYGNDEHLSQKGVRYDANADFRVRLFKNHQFNIGYSCNNNLPGLTQMSQITDYRDPMNIREGNANLKNSFTQRGNFEYQYKSWLRTTFSIGNTYNQITSLTRVDRLTGARRTSPANINGAWNMDEYIFLTYPFRDLSVSLSASHSYNHNVSFVQSFTDSEAQKSGTDYHRGSVTLQGGYSNEHWMVETSGAFSMDKSKSEYLTSTNGGKRVTANLSVSYETDFGLGAKTDCNYNKPFGYEMESANKTECIWNASVFWKFMKQRQATLSLTWRDILNSYTGFSAYQYDSTWSESRSYCETSLILLQFSYRFNQFD